MPVLRAILAVAAGVLLYNVAVIYLGGVLAAIAIPRSYFGSFGRERAELALALLNLASWALPVLVAVFLAAFVVLRVSRKALRSNAYALALGMFGAFLYWQASFAASMASHPNSTVSFGHAFTTTLLPTWWVAPNVLAPWAGLALAAWLAAKRSRKSGPREG
jgi:hypothetical protein